MKLKYSIQRAAVVVGILALVSITAVVAGARRPGRRGSCGHSRGTFRDFTNHRTTHVKT